MKKPFRWTGIGSRNVPPDKRDLMVSLAYFLTERGGKLYTGSAPGSDDHFEEGAIMAGRELQPTDFLESWLPWWNFEGRREDGQSYFVIRDTELEFAKHILIDSGVCTWINNLRQSIQKLFCRNVYQVLCSDWTKTDFVIFYAEEDRAKGVVKGGTRIAVYLARHLDIPCFNLYMKEDREQLFDLIGFQEQIHGQAPTSYRRFNQAA